MAVKIKVVREDGTKIDYTDAVVRNVLRVIDLIPYFIPYLLGAILNMDFRQEATAWGSRSAHNRREGMRVNPLLFLFLQGTPIDTPIKRITT